jgi:hypothetical protein
MHGKTGVMQATMCKYDRWIFGNTWSSNALTSGSLCGIHSGSSFQLIMLNRSPHYGNITLDPIFASVLLKTKGWIKSFFVEALITGSALREYFNCLVVLGEEPSHVSTSFILGALNERLVIGLLGGIFPVARK